MACTSMIIGEGPRSLLGQNYDFALGDGAIFVNASGKEKTSLAEGDERALHWRAKYSSVAFAQFGKELPISGMNEKGLTIQGLWNEDASYPKVNRRESADDVGRRTSCEIARPGGALFLRGDNPIWTKSGAGSGRMEQGDDAGPEGRDQISKTPVVAAQARCDVVDM